MYKLTRKQYEIYIFTLITLKKKKEVRRSDFYSVGIDKRYLSKLVLNSEIYKNKNLKTN